MEINKNSITKQKPFTLLNDISVSALSELNGNAKKLSFEKGEIIVHKGQKIGGAYLVQSGALRIYTIRAPDLITVNQKVIETHRIFLRTHNI